MEGRWGSTVRLCKKLRVSAGARQALLIRASPIIDVASQRHQRLASPTLRPPCLLYPGQLDPNCSHQLCGRPRRGLLHPDTAPTRPKRRPPKMPPPSSSTASRPRSARKAQPRELGTSQTTMSRSTTGHRTSHHDVLRGKRANTACSNFSPVPKRVMDGSEPGESVAAAVLSGAPVDLQARTVR
jgi:hypothetical protein